jgi:hypothetical protein
MRRRIHAYIHDNCIRSGDRGGVREFYRNDACLWFRVWECDSERQARQRSLLHLKRSLLYLNRSLLTRAGM